MSQFLSSTFMAACLLVVAPGACFATSIVNLSSGDITWSINADSLELWAQQRNEAPVVISTPAGDPETASSITTTTTHADWVWENRQLSFNCVAVADGGLEMTVLSRQAQQLIWPEISTPDGTQIAWPLGQGVLFNSNDNFWQHEIFSREWDAAESLSLPLCGIIKNGHTISWMTGQPFRNTVRFPRLVMRSHFNPFRPFQKCHRS